MSGLVFVIDAQGRPLMPMSPAYARKLVSQGKARFQPHHAFTILELEQTLPQPHLRPVVLALRLHQRTVELFVFATSERSVFPLLRLIVDLKTNLTRRLRRRAGHRQRRRSRSRYHAHRRFGVPYKLRRPSFMRSRWARHHRVHHNRKQSTISVPASIQWQVKAIERVVEALKHLIPVSHVVFLPNTAGHYFGAITHSSASRRTQLIEAYGHALPNGSKIARCTYCLTTQGIIEVEHIVPLSRGGKDMWSNVTLACADCNDRKGSRTPNEAGMTIQVAVAPAPPSPKRASSLKRAERLLVHRFVHNGLRVTDITSTNGGERDTLPNAAENLLQTLRVGEPFDAPLYVVKPVARPRKQQYTARRYPKSTPMRSPYEVVNGAVRRRVRVNKGLAVWSGENGFNTMVVPLGETVPTNATAFIKIGALCEGQLNREFVTGIVSAVHSTGRLTLLVPTQASIREVVWQRVAVVPRLHIRILANDGIVFLAPQHARK